MVHKCSIYDSDMHFIIDPVSRMIKNQSKKTTIVQGDHNSERFTFQIDRHVEGHDMIECNLVQIHYLNGDYAGIYDVEDLQVYEDDDEVVIFSWLLSRNVSQNIGSLHFIVRFLCTDKNGEITYTLSTGIHKEINVSETLNHTETIVEQYPDVLVEWENRIRELIENDVKVDSTYDPESENAQSGKGVNEAIHQHDTDIDAHDIVLKNYVKQDVVRNNYSNAIKRNASGEVVRVDDVSPIKHTVKTKVSGVDDPSSVTVTRCGKNLFDVNNHGIFDPNITFERNNNEYTVQGAVGGKALAYSAGVFQVKFNRTIKIADKLTISLYVTLLEQGKYDNRIAVDGTYAIFELTKDSRQKISVTFDLSRSSVNAISFYVNNNKVLFELDTLQIEIGDTATDYEVYKYDTYKPDIDGLVDIVSTSPIMTLFTDVEGANIEIEYNQDINYTIERLRTETPDSSTSHDSTLLTDRTTGKKYQLYVDNGKLHMEVTE